MKNCILCGKIKVNNRPLYCSKKCVKRAWYRRHNPDKSFFGKKKFWTTETGVGFKWEKEGAKLLGARHLPFNGKGADLDWNGKMVDVKSCNLYKRKNKRGKPVKREQIGVWVFNRNKEKPIDFFLCFCLVNNKPEKVLLIPKDVFLGKGLVIGKHSIYDKYRVS